MSQQHTGPDFRADTIANAVLGDDARENDALGFLVRHCVAGNAARPFVVVRVNSPARALLALPADASDPGPIIASYRPNPEQEPGPAYIIDRRSGDAVQVRNL